MYNEYTYLTSNVHNSFNIGFIICLMFHTKKHQSILYYCLFRFVVKFNFLKKKKDIYGLWLATEAIVFFLKKNNNTSLHLKKDSKLY